MINDKYFSILKNIQKENHTQFKPNDKFLLVDSLNTFFRSFCANPTLNDNGSHIGGLSGFLMSIGYAIRNINPTRVILCFDGSGGSLRRRKLYPDYKASRIVAKNKRMTRVNTFNTIDDEKVSIKNQIIRLIQYLDVLPVHVISVENIEADDIIAYISKQLFPNSEHVIMSTDKDYLQLINDKISIWSPTKKKYYNEKTFLEEYEIPVYNFLIYRTLMGDSSDNIPGIRGTGLKTLKKQIPILFESKEVNIDDIIQYTNDNIQKSKICEVISRSKDVLERNYKLMQLNDVDISARAKESIKNQINKKIDGLIKYQFQKMMLEDMLNTSIRNPDVWLRETFFKLDIFIKQLNQEIDNG